MRRIVKIAVRFLHMKRLCVTERTRRAVLLSMPHAALCVLGHIYEFLPCIFGCFNAARSIVCVGTDLSDEAKNVAIAFQCRTQHCVCWDTLCGLRRMSVVMVSMPHAALCVLGPG